ncbi:hypothetical protein PInf_008824 [Phytophthora infestans]|nr:hypothetical protein PInf_008824 [Phytophthora infestans]
MAKFEDASAIFDASTNSAVEGTSAVRTKEEASATEDSAIMKGDPEEDLEQVLRDQQLVIDDRVKFGVIRPSIVGEVNSAMSTLSTINAGINHVVTANSALKDSDIRDDSGAVPACHKATDYASEEYGRVDVCHAVTAASAVQRGGPSATTTNSKLDVLSRDVEANSEGLNWTMKISNHGDEDDARAESRIDGLSSADVANSAMGTPKSSIIQSASVDSASLDLNAESGSDVATACRQDISYTGDEFVFREVSSVVLVNSADQHYDATEYCDSRTVLLHEGIKPNDDPATADSALETTDAETDSDVVRRHDDDTIYLGDKDERADVISAIVVGSADTGPHVDYNYDLPEVLLLRGTGTPIGVTSSATTAFDPGGIGYSLEQARDGETACHNAVNSTGSKTVTEPVRAELSWEDDKCSSAGDPMETLSQHYVAIAATEDEQEEDVDDIKTDVFG